MSDRSQLLVIQSGLINSSYARSQSERSLVAKVLEVQSVERRLSGCVSKLNEHNAALEDRKLSLQAFLNDLKIPYELASLIRQLRESSSSVSSLKDDSILKDIIQQLSMIGHSERTAQSGLLDLRRCQAKLVAKAKEIEEEIRRKQTAIEVDEEQLRLQHRLANISFKPNATRIPKGEISQESWLDNSQSLVDQVNLLLLEAKKLREQIDQETAQGRRTIASRQDQIRVALERSIRHITDVKNDLDMEGNQIRQQIDELTRAIGQFESLEDQMKPMTQLVQTRLENRNTKRPLMGERVADAAQLDLRSELSQLESDRKGTKETLRTLKNELLKFEAERQSVQQQMEQLDGQMRIEKETLEILLRRSRKY